MRKVLTFLLIGSIIFSLTACGSTKEKTERNQSEISDTKDESEKETEDVSSDIVQEESKTPTVQIDESTPEGLLAGINADVTVVCKYLTDELAATNTQIGSTYEEYVANKQLLSDWYALVQSESQLLFARTKENSIKYFKLITAESKEYDVLDDAMDEFYDEVYDGAMDEYYDNIYDDLMDDVYSIYYDGIVEEGYDEVPYEEWSEESTACYKEWSDNSSAVYKGWSESSSNIYKLWSAVISAFHQGEYDSEAVVKELEEKNVEEQASENTENEDDFQKVSSEENSNNGQVNADLKAFLDEYEDFMEEYVEFMVKYQNSTDVSAMLSDYSEMMEKYADYTKAIQQYNQDEMSPADAAYLLEITTRVSQKLLEIAQ